MGAVTVQVVDNPTEGDGEDDPFAKVEQKKRSDASSDPYATREQAPPASKREITETVRRRSTKRGKCTHACSCRLVSNDTIVGAINGGTAIFAGCMGER